MKLKLLYSQHWVKIKNKEHFRRKGKDRGDEENERNDGVKRRHEVCDFICHLFQIIVVVGGVGIAGFMV